MKGETVSVVGGGWSLGKLSAKERDRIPGFRIGVNDAACFLKCDRAISMDRLWAEGRIVKLIAMGKPTWLRAGTTRNCEAQLAHVADRSWLHIFECDHTSTELSTDEGRLNGTNSGACALNMAFQLKPSRVILWGFDMGRSAAGEAYWYPPYPWARPTGGTGNGRYKEWAQQFAPAAAAFKAAGIEVINASPDSNIPLFPKIDPRSFLA